MRAWILAAVVAMSCRFDAAGTGDASPGDGSAAASDAAVDAAMLPTAGSAWWDDSWSVRMPLVVTNGSSAGLSAGYQIGFPFTVTGAPCNSPKAAPDDIRVVYGNTTDLPRAIDDLGAGQYLWFRLVTPLAAGASDGSDYWLYCKAPTAPPPTTGSANVFDFFDGFDTALGSATWLATNNAKISSGQLVLATDVNGNQGIHTAAAVPFSGHAIDYAAAAPADDTFWWGGFQIAMTMQPWVIWYHPMLGGLAPSTAPPVSGIMYGSAVMADNGPHIFSVEDDDTLASFRYDDAAAGTLPDQAPDNAQFHIWLWNGAQNKTVTFDWVRMRHSVYPAPAVTVGTPETRTP